MAPLLAWLVQKPRVSSNDRIPVKIRHATMGPAAGARRAGQPDVQPGRPAGQAQRLEAWLSGAGPIFIAGALIVLAAIALTSAWRRESECHGARPGRPTLVLVVAFAIYAVACAIETTAFVWFYLFAAGAAAGWFVTIPIAAFATARWVRRRRREQRTAAIVQLASWCSLLVGVGGIASVVAYPAVKVWCGFE